MDDAPPADLELIEWSARDPSLHSHPALPRSESGPVALGLAARVDHREAPLDDQGMDTQMGHLQAGSASGIGFFNTASQWALPPHGKPVATGKHMAHQQARSKD